MFKEMKKKSLLKKFEVLLEGYGEDFNLLPSAVKDKLDERLEYFVRNGGNEFDLFIWSAAEMVLYLQEGARELAAYKIGDKSFWVTRASFDTTIGLSNCKKDREEAFAAMASTRVKNKNLRM